MWNRVNAALVLAEISHESRIAIPHGQKDVRSSIRSG